MRALPYGWEGEAHLTYRIAFRLAWTDKFKCYRLFLFKARPFRWRQPCAAPPLTLTSCQALSLSFVAPSLDLCSHLPLTAHQALQHLAASLALRLLAASSECHLHVRPPGRQ